MAAAPRAPPRRPACQPGGLRLREHRGGQPIGAVERGRAAGEAGQELAQLGPEDRVVAEGGIGGLELLERADERLGDEAPAEVALDAPVAAGVGLEQAGVDGRRAGRRCSGGRSGPRGRAWRRARRRAGPCAAAHPGHARRLHAGGDVDADGGDGAGARPRRSPGSRPPARMTGTSRATAAARAASARVPVPPGCGPPAVSRRIRAAPAARWARARATARSTSAARSAASSARPAPEGGPPPRPGAARRRSLRRLAAGELDRVDVHLGGDGREQRIVRRRR